jgi:poly-gamma-glutamate synthesis protein (capsule biosynthesis protein)
MYDYGRSGLEETIEVLEKNNIDWFGVNKKNILRVIQGDKISLSGFACYSTNGSGYRRKNGTLGINPLSYDLVVEQLEEDRKNNAYSIMSFHWGDEHTNYPKYEHIELARKIVNNKDVIIHGHHPHVIQGIQKYKNSIISYSLGNFIFDDCVSVNGKFFLKQNEQNKKSFILEVEIENGTIIGTSPIGFRETNDAFEFFNIEKEIKEISSKLEQISSIDEYENFRLMQIYKVRKDKFGKRDFAWLMSRLNYYSIGARITTEIRKRKYEEISKKFK